VQTPGNVTLDEPNCMLIHGQELVMALRKPDDNTFTNTVFKMGAKYQMIELVFDKYQNDSI